MTLFEELKAATRTAHTELEQDLNLLSPELTLADYIDVLKKFYGVYVPLESELKADPFWSELFDGRWKVSHLTQDLKSFGLTDADLSAIPLQRLIGQPSSAVEILGTLYVLEGSTLGGALLAKHLASRFDLTSLKGLGFFTAYGPRTLEKWKEWKALSESLETERSLGRKLIVDQANKTFSVLRNWMCSRSS